MHKNAHIVAHKSTAEKPPIDTPNSISIQIRDHYKKPPNKW